MVEARAVEDLRHTAAMWPWLLQELHETVGENLQSGIMCSPDPHLKHLPLCIFLRCFLSSLILGRVEDPEDPDEPEPGFRWLAAARFACAFGRSFLLASTKA